MEIKKKWTRKRNKRRKELRQRWLFLKKGIKTKGSKQGVEKTRKRHTLKRRRFWQDDVHKKYVNNKKKRTNGREKTAKHRKRNKEQEKTKGVTSFYKGVQNISWRRGSLKKGGFREEQKSKRTSKKSWNKNSFEKGGKKKVRKKRQMKQNQGRKHKNYKKGTKNAFFLKKNTENTVEKKKRDQWKQEKKKKQEKEWDGLLQRMTRGRCPCHCDHRTNNYQRKMRKKEVN